MNRRTLMIPALIALVAIGWLISQAASAGALDERLRKCGANRPENQVRVVFDIARARDYRLYLPRMGDSPELLTDSPASVIVFNGPIEIAVAGAAPGIDEDGTVHSPTRSATYDNVVCVIVDGDANVYADVDTSGLALP